MAVKKSIATPSNQRPRKEQIPKSAPPSISLSASNTTGDGNDTTADGNDTTADGNDTTADGNDTTADENDTTADGNDTTADGTNETAGDGNETAVDGNEITTNDATFNDTGDGNDETAVDGNDETTGNGSRNGNDDSACDATYLEVAEFNKFKKANNEQLGHILNNMNKLSEWHRRTIRETRPSDIDSQQSQVVFELKAQIEDLRSQLDTCEFELHSQKTECDTLKKRILNGELIERPRSTEDFVEYASYLTQGLGNHLNQIFVIQATDKSLQSLPPTKASAILETIVSNFIERKKMARDQEPIDLYNMIMAPQNTSAAPPSHVVIGNSLQATASNKSQNLVDLFEDEESNDDAHESNDGAHEESNDDAHEESNDGAHEESNDEAHEQFDDEAHDAQRKLNNCKKKDEEAAIVLNGATYLPKMSVPYLYPHWQRRNNHKDTIHFLTVESIIEFLYAMPWRILIEQHQEYRIPAQCAIDGTIAPSWAKYHEKNIEFQIKWVVERFEMMWHIPIPNQIELTTYSQEDIDLFMRYDEDRKKRRIAYKTAASNIAKIYQAAKDKHKQMNCEKMLMDPGYQIPPANNQSCGWAPSNYDLLFDFANKAAKYPGRLYHTANRFTHPFYQNGYYKLFPPSKNPSSVLKKAGNLNDYGKSMLEAKFEWLFTDAIRRKYDLNMIKARAEQKWKYYESILIVKNPEPTVNGTLSTIDQKEILEQFPIAALKYTRCMFYNRITQQIQDSPVDPDSKNQAPINVPNAVWNPNKPFKSQPVQNHKVERLEMNTIDTSVKSSDSRSITHKRLFDPKEHRTRNAKKRKVSKPLSYEDEEDTD